MVKTIVNPHLAESQIQVDGPYFLEKEYPVLPLSLWTALAPNERGVRIVVGTCMSFRVLAPVIASDLFERQG